MNNARESARGGAASLERPRVLRCACYAALGTMTESGSLACRPVTRVVSPREYDLCPAQPTPPPVPLQTCMPHTQA